MYMLLEHLIKTLVHNTNINLPIFILPIESYAYPLVNTRLLIK
uniref:Uncharacterized protein n=1 Tax=Arundo donax TaxID=35708 RepID=A0A0A9CED9_ARUDO